MNEAGNDLPNAPINNNDSVESLRRQVNLLFGCLLISSFTLTVFLGLHGKRAYADLMATRSQAMEQFKTGQQEAQTIQAIYTRLADFGRTHPDFQKQILSRYNFDTNAPAAPTKK